MTQEEIDALVAAHEEDVLEKKALADALKKLPDSVSGAGNLPGVRFNCVLCGQNVTDPDDLGHQYGKFVHISCAEDRKAETKGENAE